MVIIGMGIMEKEPDYPRHGWNTKRDDHKGNKTKSRVNSSKAGKVRNFLGRFI